MVKSPERLSILLGATILPGVFEALGFTEPEQIERFYESDFYELLRNPESGHWHLGANALADLYCEVLETGSFVDPEEQS